MIIFLYMIAGVTALIFVAKGSPIGQLLTIVFSVLYGIIYICLLALGVLSWLLYSRAMKFSDFSAALTKIKRTSYEIFKVRGYSN